MNFQQAMIHLRRLTVGAASQAHRTVPLGSKNGAPARHTVNSPHKYTVALPPQGKNGRA